MIGHITILSILASTVLVNAAPPSLGSFARQNSGPSCNNTGIKPYNPNGVVDLKILNKLYSQLNTSSSCDSSQMDPCTRACVDNGVASCIGSHWSVITACDRKQTCSAHADTEGGASTTTVGCSVANHDFLKHDFRIDNSTSDGNDTDTPINWEAPSSTVPDSSLMSTPSSDPSNVINLDPTTMSTPSPTSSTSMDMGSMTIQSPPGPSSITPLPVDQ